MNDINYILIVIFIPLFIYGWYFLFSVKYIKQQLSVDNDLKFSIIIPARNEENNIAALLNSIKIQSVQPYEVIVVDDDSTDATASIAESFGGKVVKPGAPPKDWKGKPRACMIGAESAGGDVFIFLDADVTLDDNGLAKIIREFLLNKTADEYSIISISPYHKINKLYEEFSAVFNIIMTGSMNAFTPFKHALPSGLYGQCLVISKEQYFAVGGHSSVKNVILENLYLAELFIKHGYSLKCFAGKGSLSFRMYPTGFKDLFNGWSKAFASGADKTPKLTLFSIIAWISSGFIAFSLFDYSLCIGSGLWYAGILYIIYSMDFYIKSKKLGSFSLISALFFPLHLIFYCIVFFRSLYLLKSGKTVNWKSREISI